MPLAVGTATGRPADWADGGRRRVWAEVTSPEEAAAACAAGVTALVARGHESGGRVGELTTCVLLQRLLADPSVTVPVLAAGGIGPHTAAAAVAGGAAECCSTPSSRSPPRARSGCPGRSPPRSAPWTAARPPSSRATGSSPARTSARARLATKSGKQGEWTAGERRPEPSAATLAETLTPTPTPPGSPPAWAPGTCGPSCCPSARMVRSPPGSPRATAPPAASCRPYGPPSPAISTPRRAFARSLPAPAPAISRWPRGR
ncbi:nitronate monooxygenase [Streptomyces sp. RPA4-5]|uniref:nitronate monooxygenase n=1 Tax=Streptomyces sp. RPA4-5 TaxID=2721245 RepID=UPI002001DA09|nr:nitronate monooxygenase [Streptomyces sp. RPA4-5]